MTDDVIAIVRRDKAIGPATPTQGRRTGGRDQGAALFRLRPHDPPRRGKDWQASADQKAQLTQEFRDLLVRTYSNALTQYRNQQIDFPPQAPTPEDTDVVVRTEVRQPGAKPVQIDYSLDKQGDNLEGPDVMVAGVSLVTNYRDSFGQEIANGGIDGLIKSLKRQEQAARTTVLPRNDPRRRRPADPEGPLTLATVAPLRRGGRGSWPRPTG